MVLRTVLFFFSEMQIVDSLQVVPRLVFLIVKKWKKNQLFLDLFHYRKF